MAHDTYLLVIDDEQAMLDSFCEALHDDDFEIITAASWEHAKGKLSDHRYNLIIADVKMPDIEYREMLDVFRLEQRYAYIVMTAGYADIDTARDSLHQGVHDYFSKPFDRRDLTIRVRKLLEKQKLQADNLQLLDTIKVLAMALDARDHYTHGHSQQVTDYSVEIAKRMGLSFREIDNISDAGLLHDIGKIGIPDAVLLKPGRLTDEEYTKIKEHPEIGKHILEQVTSLQERIPLIYHHHERYDGGGYPAGLKGKDIPLGARILTVADSYQAMTSDRPYRKALPMEIAVAELVRNKEKQFDPEIVDIFVAYLQEQKEQENKGA